MAFVHALSLHKFLWVLPYHLRGGPRVFYKGKCGEGSRRGARPLSPGVLCFCWHIIWFFSWMPALSENLSSSEEGTSSAFPHLFFFCVSRTKPKARSWSVVRPENKSKWHVTRTQCLDGPAKVSGPHLLRAISLTPAVCRLRWKGGQGARGAAPGWWLLPGEAVGMAGRARLASRSLRRAVSQHLHERRLSVSHRVSDASSLSHGVYTFSIGQECQHVMKGLIHGGRQQQRSQSSSRYDPD